MTTVTMTLDAQSIGDDVVEADIWRDTITGVGRWRALINNVGNTWGGVFTPDDVVVITIDGSLMMGGYLDDVFSPIDLPGVFKNMLELVGRDYGFDLAQHEITAEYPNTRADDIFQAALAVIPSEIVYVSPGVAPFMNYEFGRTFLADGFREIAKEVDYDFFVNNTPPPGGPNLSLFAIAGAPATGVTLLSNENVLTDNILDIILGESRGFDIKNLVDVHSGGVKDHWSDMNADNPPIVYGWAGQEADANTTVTNVIAPPPPFAPLIGKSIIQWSRVGVVGASEHTMGIDFSAAAVAPWTNVSDYYGYAGGTVDLSERNDCHVLIRSDTRIDGVNYNCRPVLFDNAGNIIYFYALLGNPPLVGIDEERTPYGDTDGLAPNKWYNIKFPVGDDLTVPAGLSQQQWSHSVGTATIPVSAGGAFQWNNVTQIWFASIVNHQPGNFWIDDLTIPGIEARYITSNAASIIAYGQRMFPKYKGEIRSQPELVQYGEKTLAKMKDPLETASVTAIGQTGTVFAGTLVDLWCIPKGINVATEYRILSLHHEVRLSPSRNRFEGYPFISEYELTKHDAGAQAIDPLRVTLARNPTETLIQQMREKLLTQSNAWYARER